VIPNGLDAEIFKPIDKKEARSILNLPQDKILLMFGAINATKDPRKGFSLLKSVLGCLMQSELRQKIEVVIFGASSIKEPLVEVESIPCHFLGQLHDEYSLALAYSAADLFLTPSLEDNLPNTILEAMACGTPCVSFNIGGVPDLIDHAENGYLAKSLDTQDMAHGISMILAAPLLRQKFSENCRKKILNGFTDTQQARRYLDLYQKAIS
jgi:glycosyltransferase involved in cell wall biosynthesis